MSSTLKQYNNKPEKLKAYSKKSIYRKIRPSKIAKEIPNDYLTDNGYTKRQLIDDVYKLIDCNSKISFIEKKIKIFDEVKKKLRIVDSKQQFDSNQCNIFTLCPLCAEKHASRRREKYKEPIKAMAEKYEHAYMITFTSRDEPTFNLAYNNLTEGIRKYVLMGQLRSVDCDGKETRSSGEARKIKAMALSKEITIGKNSGMFHVHAHAVAFSDERIDYTVYDFEKKRKIINEYKEKFGRGPKKEFLSPAVKKWCKIEVISPDGEIEEKKVPASKASSEWIKATGGFSPNIRFDPIKGNPKSVFDQCVEIMKYASKIEGFESKHIIEILANRKGKRFFTTYGELYNSKNPIIEIDEEIETTGLKGYVWDNKNEALIPMNSQENGYLQLKYRKKEEYYAAKAAIMKGYYIKESVKFEIMNGYKNSQKGRELLQKQISVIKPGAIRSSLENELSEVIKCEPVIRSQYVNRIDSVEDVYKLFKKLTFKKHMGLKVREKDKMVVSNFSIDQVKFYHATRSLINPN